ncbi:MAG: PKD domain-containing protein [bacterium]
MKRVLISLVAIFLLVGMAACSGNAKPTEPAKPSNPAIPDPGHNNGGIGFPLQVSIQLSQEIGNAPLPINMDAKVLGGVPPFYYKWDVNGDDMWDFGGDDVKGVGITYASAGIFRIKVLVTDLNEQSFQAITQIEVKPSGPTPLAEAVPPEGDAPLDVAFDASKSEDADGDVVNYEWDFTSDGVWDYESALPTADHTYNLPGTYNATLRVTDNDDLTAETSIQVIVY